LEDAFMLPISAVLDFNTVSEISKRGYSRIPVYDTERKNIVALMHAKDLAFVDPDDKKPLKTVIEFYKHPLIHTYADETLNNVLNHFKHGMTLIPYWTTLHVTVLSLIASRLFQP
jgi:metal transporter CNNM